MLREKIALLRSRGRHKPLLREKIALLRSRGRHKPSLREKIALLRSRGRDKPLRREKIALLRSRGRHKPLLRERIALLRSRTIQERTVIPAGITLSIDSEKARKTEATVIEAERFPNAAIISERESHQIGTNKIHRWTGFICAGATIWQNPGIRVMGGPLYRKHLGAYVAGTWNCRTAPYSYEFGKDGVLEGGGNFWGDGHRRVSDWSVTTGCVWMVGKKKTFGFYGGAGYASRMITYQDIDGKYAMDKPHSYQGMIGEAGVIGRIGNFTMTTGLTFSQGYLQFSAGVGYIF